jgi:hypothetical protein
MGCMLWFDTKSTKPKALCWQRTNLTVCHHLAVRREGSLKKLILKFSPIRGAWNNFDLEQK